MPIRSDSLGADRRMSPAICCSHTRIIRRNMTECEKQRYCTTSYTEVNFYGWGGGGGHPAEELCRKITILESFQQRICNA
jgi:hypothetical protein